MISRMEGRGPSEATNFPQNRKSIYNLRVIIMDKRKTATIIGVLSIICLFAGCVEDANGAPTIWNAISLLGALVLGWVSKTLFDRMDKNNKTE